MRAVLIEHFGPAEEALQIVANAAIPEPGPDEVLVRVKATSVNPIDCAVRSGYGAEFFLAKGLMTLPLIPGRDVAGTIEAVGAGVQNCAVGEPVYAGVTNFATAELIKIPASWVAPMPKRLSFIEAAALPYAALTAWTALVDIVGLTAQTTAGKRVIVPRGAGGVGSFAIQLLKAWGAHVATIVSARSASFVRRLGADVVVDRETEDPTAILRDYDVAFDTAFDMEQKLLDALKVDANAAYVSIVTPKLRLIDRYGLSEGLKRGQQLLEERKAQQAELGRRYDWSFMEPSGAALVEIGKLIDAGKIRPLVDRVYPMESIVEAHRYCETKQAQGKIVVEITP
jgi:reticulon-4-interacting protein 1, mitochondrial